MSIIFDLIFFLIWCALTIFSILCYLFFGWIVIIIVVFHPDLSITFDSISLWERGAAYSVVVYIFGGPIWLAVQYYLSKGNELPAFFKAIAWLWPHPARGSVNQGTQRSTKQRMNLKDLARDLGRKPGSIFERKVRTYQNKKMADELDAETEWLEAEEALARKSAEVEKARARVQELKRRGKKFKL